MHEKLAEAETLLAAGDAGVALAVLKGLQPVLEPLGLKHPDMRLIMQMKAACIISMASESKEQSSWWEVRPGRSGGSPLFSRLSPAKHTLIHNRSSVQVFGLDPISATPSQVRLGYKRLATLVHPDKVAFPGAAAIFASLAEGQELLLTELAPNRGSKRRRTGGVQGRGDTTERNDDDWDDDDASSCGDLGEEGLDAEFAWWSAWDQATAKQHSQPPEQEAKARDEIEQRDFLALQVMSVEALQQEVRARQDAMLAPTSSERNVGARDEGAGAPPTLHEARAALLRARSTLNAKMREVAHGEVERQTHWDGGFLTEPGHGP